MFCVCGLDCYLLTSMMVWCCQNWFMCVCVCVVFNVFAHGEQDNSTQNITCEDRNKLGKVSLTLVSFNTFWIAWFLSIIWHRDGTVLLTSTLSTLSPLQKLHVCWYISPLYLKFSLKMVIAEDSDVLHCKAWKNPDS